MILLLTVTLIIIIQRLYELVLSRRNYLWALAKGAREYGAEHFPLFIVLHSLWILSFNLEWLLLKPPVPQGWPFLALGILTAQILRYWAIGTLGRRWNTRILIIPGLSPVTSGPYRFFRHPNYIAVCIEIAAIPALLGAWYTAAVFSLLNMSLLFFVRIPAEERVLDG
jgi:methyltransferase